MNAARLVTGFVAVALLTAAPPASAASPPRPTPGHGSDFHLLVGVEGLDLDLDPRGVAAFEAAGLDPRVEEAGLIIGVGWTFRRPLRLGLTVGGWRAAIDRPDARCTLARVAADLHLAVLEGARGSLEATFSAAFLILNYEGTGRDEHLPGSCVGIGATGRLALFGPLGLGATYQYQLGRFQPKTFEVEGMEPFRVQPTARVHGVRVTVYVDL